MKAANTALFALTACLVSLGCAEQAPPVPQWESQPSPLLIDELPHESGDYPKELIDGLSRQLVDEVNCIQPGVLASFESLQSPGHLYTAYRIPLLLRPEAVAAAEAVAASKGDYITITSGYRDVAMQYYDWLWGQRLGFLAARPGNSRHQAGLAIDVRYHDHWRVALLDHGWTWPYGWDDAPHFEWPGGNVPNLQVESVRAFQRLWNRNHEEQLIEDGLWGPNTESRMAQTPAAGFRYGGCDLDRDGYAATTIGGDDCDDASAQSYPGAAEICGDGIDQDCSGSDLSCGQAEGELDLLDDWESAEDFDLVDAGDAWQNTEEKEDFDALLEDEEEHWAATTDAISVELFVKDSHEGLDNSLEAVYPPGSPNGQLQAQGEASCACQGFRPLAVPGTMAWILSLGLLVLIGWRRRNA